MKTKLKSAWLLLAFTSAFSLQPSAFALPVSYVNLTALSTNVATTKGSIAIPGEFTNGFTITGTNFSYGDQLPVAFGKLNADIFYLYNFGLTNDFTAGAVTELVLTNGGTSYISGDGSTLILNTNGFGGGGGGSLDLTNFTGSFTAQITGDISGTTNLYATNLNSAGSSPGQILTARTSGVGWSNAPAGGGTNYLLKSFGAGNDLTITNSFTLVNSNITGYTLQSVTVSGYGGGGTNITGDTNVNGTYIYDSDIGSLTNQYGYLLGTIDPSGDGTIDGDTNRPINIADFDPSTNYVVTIVVSPDNNLGVGTWHYISRNNYTNGDYGQHASAWFSPASTNWFFANTNVATFYTTNTPAVPANGSVYQTYTNGAAFSNTVAVLATFNTTNRTPGIFIPNFTNVFPTIPTNLQWAIFQPNGTPTTNGTYTNYTLVTYSLTKHCTTVLGNGICTHPFQQLDGLSRSNNYASFCPHQDLTHGISGVVPSPNVTCISLVLNGVSGGCGCINIPPVFAGFYPIP